MWPKCAFGDQKGLILIKAMPFGNPPYHGTKNVNFEKKTVVMLLPFLGQKWGFWVKNGVLGCSGLSVR